MIEPGQKFDKYKVTRKLGEGGMSVVYQAVNPFGVDVVLKMLHPDFAGQAAVVERFRREGKIQFTLRHPNIVRVTDMVEQDGLPALVADYMEGEDLDAALRGGRRFDMPDVFRIVTRVLDAVHTAHAHGFVHRDIKPSNIFLESTDYGFEPRLMDFGIAKIEAAAALTRPQEFCGTPAYSSPEQIHSTKDVDGRTDVYSTGVVLWQLLSGEAPFADKHPDPYLVLAAVVREELPPLPNSVPAWLVKIVKRAIEKNPDHRFASAEAFKDALLAAANQSDAMAMTMIVPDPASGDFFEESGLEPRTGRTSAIGTDSDDLDSLRPHGMDESSLSGSALAVADTSDDVLKSREADELAKIAFSEPLELDLPPALASAPAAAPERASQAAPAAEPEVDIFKVTEDIEAEEAELAAPKPRLTSLPPLEPLEPVERGPTLSTRAITARQSAVTGSMSRVEEPERAGTRVVVAAVAASVLVAALAFAYSTRRPVSAPAGFARVEAGTYTIGSPADELGRGRDEQVHEVTLTHAFAIAHTEVTRGQWIDIMHTRPRAFEECGDECPVANISWLDAIAYTNQLSAESGFDPCYVVEGSGRARTVTWSAGFECEGYRLPSEAEWEVAARAGSVSALSNGDLRFLERDMIDPRANEVAWYGSNSHAEYNGASDCRSWSQSHDSCGIQPVSRKRPNAYGLYDMHGNVAEWVWDRYGPYPDGRVVDPSGPEAGTQRVTRGGGWNEAAAATRSAARSANTPVGRMNVGFRVARTLPR